MTRQLRRPTGAAADGAGTAAVTAAHSLLTSSWTVDVKTLERAIGRFTADRRLASDCQVVLFEIAGDDQLHVNVIHQLGYPRAAVRGWSGPGLLPDGCVYNRRFANVPAAEIAGHIREMVFA